MRRIYEDYAYGDAPRAACFWHTFAATPDCPPIESALDVDVAIVGAGFTGLNAALDLARSGISVAVFDAKTPGWGASGRNGGFCCLGGAKASDAAIRSIFGPEGWLEYRHAERAAVDHVNNRLKTEGIDADVHSNGETMLAHRPKDMDSIRSFAENVRKVHGVEPDVFGADGLAERGLVGPFHGGITVPIGFALNPQKYCDGLCRAATEAGASIHGNSSVTAISRAASGFRLSVNGTTVTAQKVVVATNGYSADDLPDWLRARYMPTQSNVIVTRPLSDDEIAAQGWHSGQMAYDSRTLLHYFRLMPDKRFLFGMRASLRATPLAEARMKTAIRRDFDAMFPHWAHVETPHFWSGFVCLMKDLMPFCGEVPEEPGLFISMGYHGNGVAMGSYCGALLADLVQGNAPERPYPEALSRPPGTFPMGRFRRLMMQPTYLVHGLLDR